MDMKERSIVEGSLLVVFLGKLTKGKFVVTASDDSTMRIWNPREGSTIHKISGHGFHEGAIMSMTFIPKTSGIATASEDETLAICNYNSGKIIGRSLKFGSPIEVIQFYDKLNAVAIGSSAGKVALSDVNNLKVVDERQFDSEVLSMKISEIGNLIVTSHSNGEIIAFDPRGSSDVKKWNAGYPVYALEVVGSKIIAGCDDGVIRVFEI